MNPPKSFIARMLIGTAAATASIAALRFASRLPSRTANDTKADQLAAETTKLGRAARATAHGHSNESGLYLLPDANDAFAARVLLVRGAERKLDLQYYIWHGDRSGTLLLEAVHQAADRGVQVRLLVDDNGIAGLDTVLSALDRHPNIQVRLFNPFRIRFPKWIGYVADFPRLNRRMHNKSLTADDAVTIIGGRNIGDEYFGAGDIGLFADLDVLAIGPVVADVSTDFEHYWSSEAAYPASQILRAVSTRQLERLSNRASIVERDPTAQAFVERIASLPLIRTVVEGALEFCWAPVKMLSDPPEKASGAVATESLLASSLVRAIGTPEHSLTVIAGYFVPGDEIVDEFCRLASDGVAVAVLSNSYVANDVALVHAGYAPARVPLLKAGVRLFETCGKARTHRERRQASRLGVGSTLRGSGSGSTAALRSGASTLHAKTFVIDRRCVFIGSFNLDPRSVELNTELGFLIDSTELAERIDDAFAAHAPEMAFDVRLKGDRLQWREHGAGGKTTIHDDEPGMRLADHLLIETAKRLPIRWLL